MDIKRQLKELAGMEFGEYPVTSFYLDVDGSHYSPIQIVERTHQLVRLARQSNQNNSWPKEAVASLERDLDNVTRFIGTEFQRGDWRGLVIFTCSARELWQVFPIGLPVEDKIVVSTRPCLRSLAALIDDYGRFGAILVDREKARFFEIDLGTIRELPGVTDDVPGRVRLESWYGLSDKKVERHVDVHIHQHLKHVAAEAEKVFVEHEQVDRVLIGGTPDVLPEFKRVLPQLLADRVVGALEHLMIIDSLREVRTRALEGIAGAEREQEVELTRRALEVANTNGHAVIGLEETLRALHFRALNTLLIDANMVLPGYACPACGRLFVNAAQCPECQQFGSVPVPDVIESVVEECMRQDAQTEFISGYPAWTAMGGIGGLLRFKLPNVVSGAKAAA